jgi:hypothetical protein
MRPLQQRLVSLPVIYRPFRRWDTPPLPFTLHLERLDLAWRRPVIEKNRYCTVLQSDSSCVLLPVSVLKKVLLQEHGGKWGAFQYRKHKVIAAMEILSVNNLKSTYKIVEITSPNWHQTHKVSTYRNIILHITKGEDGLSLICGLHVPGCFLNIRIWLGIFMAYLLSTSIRQSDLIWSSSDESNHNT